MYKADYNGGSILNLMASIENGLGGKSKYKELKGFDKEKLRKAKNVVLMVIDGMGYEFLMKYGQKTVFNENIKKKMTSVFSPGTSTCIPTFITGMPPEQHEMVGWYTFIKEMGTVTIPLMFVPRINKKQSLGEEVDITQVFNIKPLSNRIKRKAYVVNPSKFSESAFNSAGNGKSKVVGYDYDKAKDLFSKLKGTIKKKGKKYIYAYHPYPDANIHQYGTKHKKTLSDFKKLNTELKKFVKEMKDTILIITADHGLYDVKLSNHIDIQKHPKLDECLTLPLCGEGRLGYAYVKPNKTKQFEDYCKKKLKKKCMVYKNTDFVKKFGLLPVGKRFLDRIGDYVLVAKEPYRFKDSLVNSDSSKNIGSHGGFSKEEMFVPLIVIER